MFKKINVYGKNAQGQREYLYSTNRFKLCREAVAAAVQYKANGTVIDVAGGRKLNMGTYVGFTANFATC